MGLVVVGEVAKDAEGAEPPPMMSLLKAPSTAGPEASGASRSGAGVTDPAAWWKNRGGGAQAESGDEALDVAEWGLE